MIILTQPKHLGHLHYERYYYQKTNKLILKFVFKKYSLCSMGSILHFVSEPFVENKTYIEI